MEPKVDFRDSNKAEGETKDIEKIENEKKKKLGGIKTLPFILATEVCDRFATVGFHANMITYLTKQLNMPLVKASNTITNLDGTASLTPLIGALIADSFAGRFWTIAVGSLIYELGLITITTTALIKSLHPPPCPTLVNCQEASTFQVGILYLSLLLISLGLGGIRPCVVTFAADQLEMDKSSIASRTWNFFNWYYFSMGIARLAALSIVVYVQDNVGWGWGLGIPTIALALSFVAFVSGSPLYRKMQAGGSPIVRLSQVIVSAVRKRKAQVPEDSSLLYQNEQLDAVISVHGKLLHTNQFKWIDKAAVVEEGKATDSNPPNLWKLATVHRVEELKSFIRFLPIWAAGILFVTANSHNSSFVIQQARTMDCHLSPTFQIPPASLSIFSNLTLVTGLILYERMLVPFARRFTRNPSGISCLQRMGIGLMVNIFQTIISALTEMKRKRVAAKYNLLDDPKAIIPISVFWLVPQFFLHGIAEVFTTVGQTEFLYDQSPESMRSIGIGLYWMANSLGNYLGTLLVSLVHKYSSNQTNNWLPDRNLNRGKLDYYYWLVTCIQVLNILYYVICSWFYTSKRLEEAKEEDTQVAKEDIKNGEVQLAAIS
ncbi:hypothetical protein P3X46_004742 [Hevea brasiliensis]|uniref:Major facilitator superfamily (MFS) profile domain-containing protein n=1 Tax=Hevea brasiliensis TaxID=3981 RepID=A0ABQ9MZJ2_HEVBR|nr:protein NRT1/ PTR FAMILY 3.1-like [Hevea brasiliensis]KAJ9185070.1 hypothetical protein P3X46_004742 [Hevea brasiliensis]